MEQKIAQAILEAINRKGWNVYFRGKSKATIDVGETFRKGPVKVLEKGILYVILPQVSKPNDQTATDTFIEKHQVQPKIIVPTEGFSYLGRVVAEFSGGDEYEFLLHPGEELYFIGIELQDEEVRLLAPSKTHMPYDVFQIALETLQDITELEEVPTSG